MKKIVIVDDAQHSDHILRLLRHFRRKNIEAEVFFCDSPQFFELQEKAASLYCAELAKGCPQLFLVAGTDVLWARAHPDAKDVNELVDLALSA